MDFEIDALGIQSDLGTLTSWMEYKKYTAVEYPEIWCSTFHEEENSTRLHLLH